MFRGVSTLSIDAKGRMAIPSKYRQRLIDDEQGNMVITADQKDCLLLYPLSGWVTVEAKLLSLSSFDPDAQFLRGHYMNNASDVTFDAGGRILIPADLRERLSLHKKVVLSGQVNKFELWSEDDWKKRSNTVLEGVRKIDWKNVSDELKSFSM